MNFDDETTRKDAIRVMRDIARHNHPRFRRELEKILTYPEQIIQEKVDNLEFREGAWYRPEHNIIVPAAMIALCNREGFNRDLVFAAQIHDAGNAKMKIAETTHGADWVNADKRFKHMELGREMFIEYMRFLNSQRLITMDEARIIQLANFVGIHDAPYIHKEITDARIEELCRLYGVKELPLKAGGILVGEEARALRSADRVFVPSVLSWYKDMIAHLSDEKYIIEARNLGFSINPWNFLLCRMANFYSDENKLPRNWNKRKFPLIPEYAGYGGEGQESCYTHTEQFLVSQMFQSRERELDKIGKAETIMQFGDIFEKSLVEETSSLIQYAAAA